MVFLFGDSLSDLGNSFNILAINLLLFDLTQSIAGISLMWIVRTLSRLLLQPYLGVLVDQSDRYKLLLSVQAFNAAVAFSFVFVSRENLWLVYVLVFMLQTLNGLAGPAAGAVIPQIVQEDEIVSANILESVFSKVAATLGGLLGAVLYSRYSATLLFTLNAVSFLIAFVTILPLRAQIPRATRKAGNWLHEFAEGVRVVIKLPTVFYIFIIIFTNSLVWRLFEVLIVPLADKTQFGQGGLGYIYAALTIGGIIGAVITGRIVARFKNAIAALTVSFVLNGLPFLVLGITNDAWMYVAAMVFSGILLDVIGIYSMSAIQTTVPNELLGRVLAFQNVAIALGGLPALLSLDVLTRQVGYHLPFVFSAALIVVVGLFFGIEALQRQKTETVKTTVTQ
jgi:predicted MFS family arabinose efflux permease